MNDIERTRREPWLEGRDVSEGASDAENKGSVPCRSLPATTDIERDFQEACERAGMALLDAYRHEAFCKKQEAKERAKNEGAAS